MESRLIPTPKKLKIIEARALGTSFRDIAENLQLSKSGVQRIWAKYQDSGDIKNHWNNSWRPKLYNQRTSRRVINTIKHDPFKILSDVKRDLNLQFSRQTIHRILSKNGYRSYASRKKFQLYNYHKKQRVLWAKRYRNWSVEDWEKVVYGDESKFNVGFHDGKKKYRKLKSDDPNHIKYMENKPKNARQSVMLWGGFGIWGLTDLIFIEGNMNGKLYTNVLNEGYIPFLRKNHLNSRQIYLLEDNDKKHKSKIAQKWKSDNHINFID